jgi:predicted transcriptional regulator
MGSFKDLKERLDSHRNIDINKLMFIMDLFDEEVKGEFEQFNERTENVDLDRCILEGLNNRRSDIEIVAIILKIARRGAIKTKILYQANLSYYQLQNYLIFMIRAGFIEKNGDKRVKFTTTSRGKTFLYHWMNIRNLFEAHRFEGAGTRSADV